jgi:hypothetical protein
MVSTAKAQPLTDVPNVTLMFVGVPNITLHSIHDILDAIERDAQNHRGRYCQK